MSHLPFLFMCDLTLKKERIESSSYALSVDMALLVACLGPGARFSKDPKFFR